MAFTQPPAPKMPRLACVGHLEGLDDGKRSQSGEYMVQKYRITAAAGKNAYGNILYRPEWFNPAFNPAGLDPSAQTVYGMHMISGRKNEVSTLAGLVGSPDNFAALQEMAEKELTQYTDDEVSDFLRRTIEGVFGGTLLGYELKQVFDKDEEGRKTIPRDKYEVGGWFYPSEKTLDAKRKRAESNKEKAAEAGQRPTFLAAF